MWRLVVMLLVSCAPKAALIESLPRERNADVPVCPEGYLGSYVNVGLEGVSEGWKFGFESDEDGGMWWCKMRFPPGLLAE